MAKSATSKKSALDTFRTAKTDPTLDALFSSSLGPVTRPPTSRYTEPQEPVSASLDEAQEDEDDEDGDDQDGDDDGSESGGSEEESGEDADEEDLVMDAEGEDATPLEALQQALEPSKSRKRKRKDESDGLESRYLDKLSREEETDHAAKKQKGASSSQAADAEDASSDNEDDDEIPVHESLAEPAMSKERSDADFEKAAHTVFLSNVSSEAVSSKAAKKTLLAHLSKALDATSIPAEKIESIRFRSIAFSTTALPKRAAFIKRELMDATAPNANAYVVYSTAAAARRAVSELNGTIILDRHLRVDSVAHPSPTDHRRCVFVGNLAYIDDETIETKDKNGNFVTKKRTKVPADIEEGLWRTFGKEGRKVENVRVVRDPKTRVGKGFAYVQFYDGNDVETALLLNGKKFPPMLPRILRVTRAKPPHKTALAMERAQLKKAGREEPKPNGSSKTVGYAPKLSHEEKSKAGRTSRLLGQAAAVKQVFGGGKGGRRENKSASEGSIPDKLGAIRPPEDFIAEGRRASVKDGLPSGLAGKKQRAKGAGKKAAMRSRGQKRATEWRKNGKGKAAK